MLEMSCQAAFAAEIALGGKVARAARAEITMATLRHNPALKAAVRADCEALAKAGVKERGYADLMDLTRAGYDQNFALHMAEVIAAAGRKLDATRDFVDDAARQDAA